MSYHGVGLGQLSMSPETLAKLQSCTTSCESKYGVASGHPDVIQLTACFANCNVTYPPTMATPAGSVTPRMPTVQPPEKPQPLLTLPTPAALDVPSAPAKPGMSAGMKLGLAVAGIGAVGLVGYLVYRSQQKMTGNPRRPPQRAARSAYKHGVAETARWVALAATAPDPDSKMSSLEEARRLKKKYRLSRKDAPRIRELAQGYAKEIRGEV